MKESENILVGFCVLSYNEYRFKHRILIDLSRKRWKEPMMKKIFFRQHFIRLNIFIFMTLGLVGCGKASSYYKDANKNYEAGQYEEAAICLVFHLHW